jgi:hypothetical protein
MTAELVEEYVVLPMVRGQALADGLCRGRRDSGEVADAAGSGGGEVDFVWGHGWGCCCCCWW